MFEALKNSFHDKFHKYKKWEPLVFFLGGFCFDASLLHRIDDPLMLVHQATYLTLCALIIAYDLVWEERQQEAPRWLSKIWKYREGLLHFMLGTLLNVYTIFYFKSGSFLSSLSFLALLALLLFLNEARPKKISKHVLRNALFSLCLISYLNILVSILVGSIGEWVFFLAIAAAYGVQYVFFRFLKYKLEERKDWREIRVPFLSIALIYILLYLLQVLPPVPLSVKYMGIYREVTRQGEYYRLASEKPSWRFWQKGDQLFRARPGDKIYCFVQIFSPARFRDQLFVRWLHYEPRGGWKSWDAIPLPVVGGREEGFRGYTAKTNYEPGEWRVKIETRDGREVGRLSLNVEPLPPGESLNPLHFEMR